MYVQIHTYELRQYFRSPQDRDRDRTQNFSESLIPIPILLYVRALAHMDGERRKSLRVGVRAENNRFLLLLKILD